MRYILPIFLIFFLGCSTKEVFIPNNVEEVKLYQKFMDKELIAYTKNGLTFKDQNSTYDENFKDIKGFFKINKDIAVKGNQLLEVSTGNIYKFNHLIVSATKKSNLLAIVFNNGDYGIYDMNSKQFLVKFRSDASIDIDFIYQQPIFYGNIVIFPLLDGSISFVDLLSKRLINNIIVSKDIINNSIIYMKIMDKNLMVATHKKLLLISSNFVIEYKKDIKYIIDDNKYLYLFTNNSEIIKLTPSLKEIKKVKLLYADFSYPSICNNSIYSIEKQGYILKINPNLDIKVLEGKYSQIDTSSIFRIYNCKIYNTIRMFSIE